MGELERIEALEEAWDGKRAGRRMPARADFPMDALRPWIGNLGIYEVRREPLRFLLSLAGNELIAYDGDDFTGCCLDEYLPPALGPLTQADFECCVALRAPVSRRFLGRLEAGDPVRFRRLLLPLGADGETVDTVLACIYADYPTSIGGEAACLNSVMLLALDHAARAAP